MNYRQILELYSLEEVLERLSLEPVEWLELLENLGYLDDVEITEPLE